MGDNGAAAASADPTVGPVKMPGEDNKDRMGVEKNTKIIRILTVIAYVCSVSMAAVMLSLYYVFIWDPTPSGGHPAPLVQDPPQLDKGPILHALLSGVESKLFEFSYFFSFDSKL